MALHHNIYSYPYRSFQHHVVVPRYPAVAVGLIFAIVVGTRFFPTIILKLVRQDMGVNEDENRSDIIQGHKLQQMNITVIALLYLTFRIYSHQQ